jgi:hypothetical protein
MHVAGGNDPQHGRFADVVESAHVGLRLSTGNDTFGNLPLPSSMRSNPAIAIRAMSALPGTECRFAALFQIPGPISQA